MGAIMSPAPKGPMPDPAESPANPPRRLLYSPMQVKLAAFFGGPLAGVYLLQRNFLALERPDAARRTLLLGLGLCLLLLAGGPFLSPRFPRPLLPILYSYLAGHLAETQQLSREAIAGSDRYGFQPNGRVAWIGLACLLVFLAALAAHLLALQALGMLRLG